MPGFTIGDRRISLDGPTYFIADISANHDGELSRAKDLINLAAEAGADAAKFQHFLAPAIVSRYGFEAMGQQAGHQAAWRKSVFEVYQEASLPREWTVELKRECTNAGIEFFSTPYDFAAVELLRPHVRLWKIGSGDITWLDFIDHVAATGLPVILASGASELGEVQAAMEVIARHGVPSGLMQCNTNYTGSLDNFRHIQLNVLRTYSVLFPEAVLGLSDHTPGHSTVCGAVALGARLIEKHFTDDTRREGPDHPFSMDPPSWREMVERTREIEEALGDGQKRVEENERETVILQRRCVRAARDLPSGTVLKDGDLEVLRPATPGALLPTELKGALGHSLRDALVQGQEVRWTDLIPQA